MGTKPRTKAQSADADHSLPSPTPGSLGELMLGGRQISARMAARSKDTRPRIHRLKDTGTAGKNIEPHSYATTVRHSPVNWFVMDRALLPAELDEEEQQFLKDNDFIRIEPSKRKLLDRYSFPKGWKKQHGNKEFLVLLVDKGGHVRAEIFYNHTGDAPIVWFKVRK